ncbi:unnamed protein product [Arabidopsis lyrata]|nr:unnamed protein product [Arabidopsis lyrata]
MQFRHGADGSDLPALLFLTLDVVCSSEGSKKSSDEDKREEKKIFTRWGFWKQARGGESPLSPIKILSKLQKIGNNLSPGKQEKAHEFLRYAVETMQYVFLKEAHAAGPFAEETTLRLVDIFTPRQQQFLGFKIKCLHKSELMMDLSVEIDGDIGSLEEALAQVIAYEKAKKKLMILEGPDFLTVVLKCFQSDNFGKLSKPIYFPELLDIFPYMSDTNHSDHPVYSLYAVIGSKLMAAMFSRFNWRLDSLRPVSNNGGRKSKERRNLAAIPLRHDNSKDRDMEKSLLPRVDWSSGSLSSMFSSSDTTSSCSTKDSSGHY